MALEELKPLIEEGNRKIEAIRTEVESRKSADFLAEQKLAKMEADLAATLAAKQAIDLKQQALEARLSEVETKSNRPGSAAGNARAAEEHKAAFIDYIRKGANGGADQRLFDIQQKAADVRTSTNASGGFALPKVSRVILTGTTDYHQVVNTGGFGAEWVGETSTRTLGTTTPNFADVVPSFGELSAVPEATRHSISDLFFDVEAMLVADGAERFAITEGLAFVSGDGTNKPTGFLSGPTPVTTADATRAFGTLQYIATGQAAALATNAFDTFKDLQYTLRAGYRTNARWVMNSIVMSTLAKVKDTTGQYLLQPSVAADDPDTIDGKPITIAEDMPNIGAGNFPVAFGDFARGYLIADIPGIWMARDEITKVGWVRMPMAKRVGGKLLDTNAIKLMKVAAS